jgi:hypothetical protein
LVVVPQGRQFSRSPRGTGACRVPHVEQHDGLVGLEPQQGGRVRPDELGEFLVDHREQLVVADPAAHERGHPQQGRLLGHDLVHIAIGPARLAGTAGPEDKDWTVAHDMLEVPPCRGARSRH